MVTRPFFSLTNDKEKKRSGQARLHVVFQHLQHSRADRSYITRHKRTRLHISLCLLLTHPAHFPRHTQILVIILLSHFCTSSTSGSYPRLRLSLKSLLSLQLRSLYTVPLLSMIRSLLKSPTIRLGIISPVISTAVMGRAR